MSGWTEETGMSGGTERQFDLAHYEYASANRVLTKRLFPWALRNMGWLSAITIVVVYIAGSLANRAGHPLPALLAPLLLVLIALAPIYGILRRRRLLWDAISRSPLRCGPNQLSTDEEGFTLRTPSGHVFVRWSHVSDVIDGPDGLLLTCGAVDYYPVPDAAFSDPADKERYRRQVRNLIAANRSLNQ
jgi:hypothetical protein